MIVITEQQIESRGYQDLSDVLKDIPGFDVPDNAARFGEFYTLRGIPGNERMLVLIDGHKINPPTGTLLSVGNSISVRFAKQIEIIYGPASAMYGADAFSGIINIISKTSYHNTSNLISAVSYGSNSSVDAMVESRAKVNDDLSFTVSGRMLLSDGFNIRSIPPYASDQLFGKAYKYEGAVADSIDKTMVSTESRIAGFGQPIWSPVQTLDLVIGGRYDYSSQYEGTFNPRLGFTYNPFSKTLIKFDYATAFQAPSLFYQYEQFGTPTDVMLSSVEVRERLDPSWSLKNQLVSTYELSFTQQLFEALQFKVSGYYNHLTDIIERVTYDPDSQTYNKYFDNLSRGIRNENIGVQTVKGFNTEVNYGIADKLETYFYYCYTDGIEETSAGDVGIPRISENKIWVGATYDNLFDYLTISPRFRWIGDMNNANKTAFPTGKQDGYASLDLSLSANRIFGFMKFYALFNNLLDQKIYHGGLYEQAGGHLAAIPEEGFRFQSGLQINLVR